MKTSTRAMSAAILVSATIAAHAGTTETVEKVIVTGNRIGQTTEQRLGTSASIVTATIPAPGDR